MSLQPFAYPLGRHVRKHGPDGYPNYRSYRPWLRDEFAFRCVYCLWRELWFTELQIDHFLPKKLHPELAANYDNLVYACAWCNRRKSVHLVPDPCTVAYADCVTVQENGSIRWHNPIGRALVKYLGLATKRQKERRAKMIEMARYIESNPGNPRSEAQLRRWFGYPSDLPSLEDTPVERNTRLEGLHESHYVRRDSLPPYY